MLSVSFREPTCKNEQILEHFVCYLFNNVYRNGARHEWVFCAQLMTKGHWSIRYNHQGTQRTKWICINQSITKRLKLIPRVDYSQFQAVSVYQIVINDGWLLSFLSSFRWFRIFCGITRFTPKFSAWQVVPAEKRTRFALMLHAVRLFEKLDFYHRQLQSIKYFELIAIR